MRKEEVEQRSNEIRQKCINTLLKIIDVADQKLSDEKTTETQQNNWADKSIRAASTLRGYIHDAYMDETERRLTLLETVGDK